MEKKNNILQNSFVVAILASICCALWGSAAPTIKIGYELMLPSQNTASTMLFAGMRFFLAGVLTILGYSLICRRFVYPKKENVKRVFTISMFQTVIQYILFYVGLVYTSGVKTTVLSGSNAFFSLLIACFIFRQEKFTLKKIIACIIGFLGIVVINFNGLDFSMTFMGEGFILLSTVAYAVSSVLIKRFSKYEDTVILSGYQFALGGMIMMLIGKLFGGTICIENTKSVLILLYLAFLSAMAYGLWGILLKHNPVTKITIYSCTIPVFGVILSMLLLSEDSNVSPLNLLITLVMICSGIILLNYQKKS